MKYIKINLSLIVLCFIICVACDPLSPSNQNLPESNKSEFDTVELKLQSDEIDKSIEEINNAMNQARLLNEKIQLVEKQYDNGKITRLRANKLITTLNEQFGKQFKDEAEQSSADLFPEWAKELGLSEPEGMIYDANASYQTKETEAVDGYNSILFVYKGAYRTALKEASRIAQEAMIPMSENYKKAQELSVKLGKEIEGLKGMTYMNYRFGKKDDGQKFHISINVDEHGKLTLTVVDVKRKSERRETAFPK